MIENKDFVTGVDYYHSLNLVFNLMLAVPLLPFSFLYLANLKGLGPNMGISAPYGTAIDIVVAVAITLLTYYALRLYRLQRDDILSQEGLREKLVLFNRCLIRMYLLITISACLSVIGFLMTQGNIHIVLFVLLLVVLSLKRPTLTMIVQELKLVGKESDILRNREPITFNSIKNEARDDPGS